jgi:hypothetical protein
MSSKHSRLVSAVVLAALSMAFLLAAVWSGRVLGAVDQDASTLTSLVGPSAAQEDGAAPWVLAQA